MGPLPHGLAGEVSGRWATVGGNFRRISWSEHRGNLAQDRSFDGRGIKFGTFASIAQKFLPNVFPRLDADALREVFKRWQIAVRYNVRGAKREINTNGDGWKPFQDLAIDELRDRIAKGFRYRLSKGATAALKYGEDSWRTSSNAVLFWHQVDPFLAWLKERPAWDRTPRIDGLIPQVFSEVRDKDLAAWIAQFLFIGPIQRAFEPGCLLREMPVLIGPQGAGKSALLRSIFPTGMDEWFCDTANLGDPLAPWKPH